MTAASGGSGHVIVGKEAFLNSYVEPGKAVRVVTCVLCLDTGREMTDDGSLGQTCDCRMDYAMRKVKARKTHWCSNDYAHDRRINPGDEYFIYTDFPNSDLGYAATARRPVQLRMCAQCGGAS